MSDLTTLLEHLLGLPEEAFFLRVRHNWHKGNVVPGTGFSPLKNSTPNQLIPPGCSPDLLRLLRHAGACGAS